MAIPLTKICPECQQEMELITADDVGEILVYECPECGYQEETRVEREDEGLDELPPPGSADLPDDEDMGVDQLEPDETE
jgi:DNA-directed RNA polymerase subunit M/transcription elongation factor TFIIS